MCVLTPVVIVRNKKPNAMLVDNCFYMEIYATMHR